MPSYPDVKQCSRYDSNLHGLEMMAERASKLLERPVSVSQLNRWIDEYTIIHAWKTGMRVRGKQIHTHVDSLDDGAKRVCEKIEENKKKSTANLWRSTWTIQTG
jgi:hypothetical protein